MSLEEAIDLAEKRKAQWEKYRGQAVHDYIWYVVPFNDGYCLAETPQVKRHPAIKKQAVYDTQIGIYKL